MAEKSSIEWTDATWNTTRGCTKIAQGCKNCYAETFAERFRGVEGHPYEQGFDPRLVPEKLTEPLKWKKPRRIFVDSMSDLFHEAFPFEYIAACFGVMAACPQHTFQVLTKRPGRALEFFRWLEKGSDVAPVTFKLTMILHDLPINYPRPLNLNRPWPLPNVWLGTSIAHQPDADKNVPILLQIPAAVRFLSVEPMIGPVDLEAISRTPGAAPEEITEDDDAYGPPLGGVGGIDWVIVGGESGHHARPMHPEWARKLRDQCVEAGVPFFFKQWGEWLPVYSAGDDPDPSGRSCHALPDGTITDAQWNGGPGPHLRGAQAMWRVGKKAAGRLLDGRPWDEFPKVSP